MKAPLLHLVLIINVVLLAVNVMWMIQQGATPEQDQPHHQVLLNNNNTDDNNTSIQIQEISQIQNNHTMERVQESQEEQQVLDNQFDEQCLFHMLILTVPRLEIEGSRYHYLKSTLNGLYSQLGNTIFMPCVTVFNPNPIWRSELEEAIPEQVRGWKRFRILENQYRSDIFQSPSMSQKKKNQSNNFFDMMKTFLNVSTLERNVVFMEDDFVMCEDVSSHFIHVLNKASDPELFSGVRFSFGLNGVLVQRRDLPQMIYMCEEYAFKDFPIDNLLEEFLNKKTKMGKDYFKNREFFTYRYQLMEHIGKISSVGNDRDQEMMDLTFPHCYETQIYSQIMNQYKLYCAHSLFSPCDRPKKLQFSHDVFEFPLKPPTLKITLSELNKVESVLCEEGEDCDTCCKKIAKTCDVSFFPYINHCREIQKHSKERCNCKIDDEFFSSIAPSMDTNKDCYVGYRPSRFSCSNKKSKSNHRRLCPCKS